MNPYRIAQALAKRLLRVYLRAESAAHNRQIRRRIPEFPSRDRIEAAARDLRNPYEHYVREVSTAQMAASLPTCALLLAICRSARIETAMDLGSGFSSYVLHRWSSESGATIVSIDDDPDWLARTRRFLDAYGFGSPHLCLWPDVPREKFDLVFHDLANADLREMAMQTALDSGRRFVVFDDAQHFGHRRHMRAICSERSVPLFSLRTVTLDQFHRYAMMAVLDRPA